MRLQGKFEIDHSWRWKGKAIKVCVHRECLRAWQNEATFEKHALVTTYVAAATMCPRFPGAWIIDTHGTKATVRFDRVDYNGWGIAFPYFLLQGSSWHLREFTSEQPQSSPCRLFVKILMKTFLWGIKDNHSEHHITAMFTMEMVSINWILRMKRRHKRNHVLYLEQMSLLNSRAKWPAEWHGRWSRKPSPLPRRELSSSENMAYEAGAAV